MTELYQRILLWHKLVASTTGGLALCSARHRLNRDEAKSWADTLRNVSDEIREVVEGRPFILDDKGRRVVESGIGLSPRVKSSGPEVEHDPVTHDLENTSKSGIDSGAVVRKKGGPRVLRKRQ